MHGKTTRVILLTTDAHWGEALARTLRKSHRSDVEIFVTRSRPTAIGWVRSAGSRAVLVVAELDCQVPNQGMEALLYARRVRPEARLLLIAAPGRASAWPSAIEATVAKEGAADAIIDRLRWVHVGRVVERAAAPAAPPGRREIGAPAKSLGGVSEAHFTASLSPRGAISGG